MKAFYDETAEKSLIQAFITKPAEQKNIAQLVCTDFYPSQHQHIFAALQSMYASKKDIDLGTIPSVLREMYGEEETPLMNLLVEIVTNFAYADTWAIKSHIEIVKACAMRRRMVQILDGAKDELQDESNETAAVLDKTRQLLRDMVVTRHVWKGISDVLMETFTDLEKRSKGEVISMPSGISDLELITTGFHKGELTIIGARPAVGKSALGAHIALASAKRGFKVGIVSREMSSVQYGTRIISNGTDMDNKKLRTGEIDSEDWTKIAQTMALYSHLNISFMFSTRYIEDLRMEVQKKVDSGELDLLVVDYVQLMQSKQKFDKDYLRIAYVSKMLKDMTTDLNIAIIGLAQVGRAADSEMPTLAELRGSGDLEQDADNVIFMHRPADVSDKYVRPDDKTLFQALRESQSQYIAIKVAKQRQGEIGSVSVVFDPKRMRFTKIERNLQ